MSLLNLGTELAAYPDLSDKTYLITGAANGIGRALAIVLAENKATVILLDKDEDELNSLYDQIKRIDLGEPVIVHQDLTLLTNKHCDTLVSEIRQSFGKLNGIVHCASETGHLAPIEHYSDDDWSKVIKANLHSPYLLTRSLITLMDKSQPASIIFSVSQQAIRPSAYWGAFAVAQHGLKALVQTWSEETEHSDTCLMMLDPGKVNTHFLVSLYPGLDPNQFPDAKLIAQAYAQLAVQPQKNLHGRVLQINELEVELVE